jgi:hypothetical protein
MDIAYISYQAILVDNPYYSKWSAEPSLALKIMLAKSNISWSTKYSWIEQRQIATHYQATLTATNDGCFFISEEVSTCYPKRAKLSSCHYYAPYNETAYMTIDQEHNAAFYMNYSLFVN